MLFLDIDQADVFHQEALNTAGISTELRLRANFGLSENAVYRGDMVAAERYVQNALVDIHENTSLELRLLYGFAKLEVMLRSGQFEEADTLLLEVYKLEPDNLRTATYEAQLRYYQSRFHAAASIFERIRNQDPSSVYLFTLENDLAISYWWTGNLEKAEQEALKSLEHWRNSPHVEALSRMHMGFIRLSQGRFSEALDYMQQAKNDSLALGSVTYEADVEQHMGVIYSHAGQYDTALNHLHRALELMKSVGDPYREALILGTLVAVYATKGDIPHAEQYLQIAEQPTAQSQNLAAKGFLTQAKSVVSLQQGRLDEARAYNLEAEAFARQTELPEFLCFILLHKAKLEPDPAPPLTQALEIAIARGFKLQEYFAAQALGDTTRAETCLKFLREHAPEGWF